MRDKETEMRDKETECWMGAYNKIMKTTGFSLDRLYDKCLVLVKDRNSEYYGKIGILENYITGDGFEYVHVKFKPKITRRDKKIIFEGKYKILAGIRELEDKLFITPNAIMLLEEADNMWKLFST